MKKLLICLMLGTATMSACKKDSIDPTYNLSPNIYFDWSDSTGTDASRVDSFSYTFALTPEITADTVYLPVRISGDRSSKDRFFKIGTDDTATTAIAGLHYAALKDQYVMPADSGEVHVPIYFSAKDTALASRAVRISFKLLPTSDFTTTDTKYNVAKYTVSSMLTKPSWWDVWGQLGIYSRVKFELYIRITGLTYMTPVSDFDHQPQMFYALGIFGTFLSNPIQWVANNPNAGFTITEQEDGSYLFYQTAVPTKTFVLLPPDQYKNTYHFNNEDGQPI